ncbi:leucine-rich repeat domain-containing protein [uncultured Paraprevotella sp.]|uniref:leucine-rich repeat domain-containing protein n=1 Tax=Paraprevotella clara TaxID=454154 RepID=UPI00259B3BC3|nr:leucine-rich repeat domain-containing protein [uncultured Paraprevotella sp.]
MKKYLLSILFAMFGIITYAQNEPAITLTAKVEGKPLTLNFAVSEAGHKFKVDWGDGNLVETEEIAVDDGWTTTTVTGTPLGEGKISVYGEKLVVLDCSYAANDGTKLTALDVTKATDLTKLTCNTHEITTLDVSKNVNLTELVCSNNPITSLDLSANTQLTSLDGTNMSLTEIDVTKNTALKKLMLNDNQIESIDLSANPELNTLNINNNLLSEIDLSQNTALATVNIQSNKLSTLDLSMCDKLSVVFCNGNEITSLKVGSVKTRLNCSDNRLSLANLPLPGSKYFIYAPQKGMPVAQRIWPGETIDLSAQDNLTGLAAEAQKTTFVWKKGDTELQEGTDYTVENNVFTFLKAFDEPVYCEMATAAFPDFADANIFKTENVTVETEPELYLTLTAQVDGNERNLTFASTTEANRIIVDWGDGKRVASEVIAMADEYGTTTTVTGTPAGEGHIKIYAREISVFGCDSRVDGAQVTAINTSAATDLRELNVYTNALTILDVSKNTALEVLNCYNNPITALDLSANTMLKTLDAKNMELTEIDLAANTALNKLTLSDNKLTGIDLGKNTELTSLYILNNQIADIDLSNNTKLTYVSLNGNKLTSLDVTACKELGSLFCMNNQLTELKADNVTKSVNCSKNNFTLATLPALGCNTYTYAPQNAMQIAAEVKAGETVDLSAQDNISGLLDCKVKTTYTWLTEDGEALVAGTDYTEEEGVFTFLVKQDVPVYCEMTTAAFPKFSGSNTFKTTTTLVEGGSSIEGTRHNTPVITATRGNVLITGLANGCDVKVYNLSGQAIAVQTSTGNAVNFSLEPGLYIVKANHISCKVNAQ